MISGVVIRSDIKILKVPVGNCGYKMQYLSGEGVDIKCGFGKEYVPSIGRCIRSRRRDG